MVEQCWSVRLCRGGSRGRVQGVRTPPPERAPNNWYSPKICRYVWYVFSAVHIMLLPSQKPSTYYLLLKFVFNYQSVTLFLCGAPPSKKSWIRRCHIHTIHKKLSGILWPPIRFMTLNFRNRRRSTTTTTKNFINKLIIWQRHCPQLPRLFEAGPGNACKIWN